MCRRDYPQSSYRHFAHTAAAAAAATPFILQDEYDEFDVEWRNDASLSTRMQLITSQIAVGPSVRPSVCCMRLRRVLMRYACATGAA